MGATQPGQPGLFIAGRPWLSLIILFAGLALIGFAGGALNDEGVRAAVFATAAALAPLTIAALLVCALPLLAPTGARARTGIALAVIIFACVLMILQPQIRSLVPLPLLVPGLVAVSLLLLTAPGYGRAIIAGAVFAPLTAYAAAFAALGYIYRSGLSTDQLVLQLLVLILALALVMAVMFVAHLANQAASGQSGALASGHAVNRLLRDIVFLAVGAGIMLRFYMQDPVSASTGLSLFAAGAGLVLFAALPIPVAGAAAVTTLPVAPVLARAGEAAQDWSTNLFRRILARASPTILTGFFAAVTLLALVALIELPPAAALAADTAKPLWLSALIRVSFYGLIFGLASVIYGSLRVSVFAVTLFILSDILAAALMTLLVTLGLELPAPAVMHFADAGPRLLVLAVLIRLAAGWRDALSQRGGQDVPQLLARRALTMMAALMLGVVVFVAAGIILPEAAGWAGYMGVKLLLQSLIVLALLPLAMAVLSRLQI